MSITEKFSSIANTIFDIVLNLIDLLILIGIIFFVFRYFWRKIKKKIPISESVNNKIEKYGEIIEKSYNYALEYRYPQSYYQRDINRIFEKLWEFKKNKLKEQNNIEKERQRKYLQHLKAERKKHNERERYQL